jgi:septal ring-binding cell division protein DamX
VPATLADAAPAAMPGPTAGIGPAAAATADAKEPATAAPAKASLADAPAPASPPPLERRLEAGVALIDGAGSGQWVIQLMTTDARERAHLQSFLAEATASLPPGRIHVYPAGSADAPKVGVLCGTFATRLEATQALEALPAAFLRFRPYVRPVEAVRAELRRGPPA